MKSVANYEAGTGYIFHAGQLAPGYRYDFRMAVFNAPAYRLSQAAMGWQSFYILHPDTMSVHGHIHFHLRDGLALSPLRAPFGSLEASAAVTSKVLTAFMEFVGSRLTDAGAARVTVKTFPEAYQPRLAEALHAVFSSLHYEVSGDETTSIIFVSESPFGGLMHPRKTRRLRQTSGYPFTFSQLQKEFLPELYDFIATCRERKKYPLSMTLEELQKAFDQFPEAYHLFAVRHGEHLVAATVAVRIYDDVLYHFVSDHIHGMGGFTPALVLMEGLYNFCLEANIRILDLGTSAPNQQTNPNLMRFKKELGGQPNSKRTYVKLLA